METSEKTEALTATPEVKPDAPESVEEMIRRIDKNIAKQTRYARLRFYSSLLGIAVVIVALLAVGMKVFPLLDQVSGTLTQVSTTIDSMKLGDMAKSVTDLATTGTAGINDALKQVDSAMDGVSSAIQVIEGLNIDGLNGGIEKLNEVLEPMAKFFGRK